MLKNKLVLLVALILSCVLQIVGLCQHPTTYFENGFIIGLDKNYIGFGVLTSILPLMLTVCFILFFTSGTVENLMHGYGKVLIVRDYSKTLLILKRCLSNCRTLICIVIFQLLVFLLVNNYLMPVESGMLKSVLMYFLILNALVLTQCFLEMYIPVYIVNILIFIYCSVSYYLVQMFFHSTAAKLIMFPCLLFGMQNGAVSADNTYYLYLAAAIIMNLLLVTLCIRRFKKIDIF